MYDWAPWLLAQIPLALIVAVAYFGRDTLASWLNAKTKHSFDTKLEALKADLAAKGKEIDTLRTVPMSARAARQALVDKRRLEAIDQIWAALKVMQQGKSTTALLGVMKWDAVADLTERDGSAREMFKTMADSVKIHELFNHNAPHFARSCGAV
ncbi:hypothetical protein ACCS67_08605 [Rhizobium brockwellii]|uniref:hypothetical protein n=1 Tax=Rhizobium brockwellii TaxID=3019932 RepID=UPI003F9DF526